MHAKEWVTGYCNFARFVGTEDIRKSLGRAKGQCTWCAAPAQKPFQRWCSAECRDEYRLYCWPAYYNDAVHQRDKGICAICGIDTARLLAALMALRDWRFRYRWCRAEGFAGSIVEVDHIVPVIEGGGCCGLDGLRTLCAKCHKGESKKLAARRSAARPPKPAYYRCRKKYTP